MKIPFLVILTAVVTPCLALAQDAGKAAQPAAAPAAAQPAADQKIDPEAQKLLDESRTAMKKVRDMSFSVAQESKQGGEPMKGSAKVMVAIPEQIMGFPFTSYRFDIMDKDGKPATAWASYGKKIQKLDHAGKKLLTLDNPAQGVLPWDDLSAVFPQWMMDDLFGNPAFKTASARLLPDAEVGGVKCKVVERVQEAVLPEMDDEEGEKKDEKKDEKEKQPRKFVITWVKHIAADDHLVRKFEMHSSVIGEDKEGMGGMFLKGELKDVKVNGGLKEEDFGIKAPDGYAAETGTYESMGLQDPMGAPSLKVKAGDAALAFKLSDADGKEVTLEGLKGRVVLLDFWATWCGPCKAAMPSIQKIHEKYADKPLSVLGVNTWERKADAGPKYMKDNKFTYACLLKGDDLAKSYGISGIPTMILIDKEGKVIKFWVGFDENEGEEMVKLIDEALAKK